MAGVSYELAKELKGAGFPQGSATGNHHDGGGWIDEIGVYRHHETTDDAECYVPTLSELIEACGDDFTKLEREVGNPFDYSNLLNETVWWSAPYNDYVNPGATPEEAVARLWLALNGSRERGVVSTKLHKP